MNLHRKLPDVIAEILTHNGALVEHINEDNIEVIVPPEVSQVIAIPEHARLFFSYQVDDSGDNNHFVPTLEKGGEGGFVDNAVYASYDSEFLKSIMKLFTDKGKFSVARLKASIPNTEKLKKSFSDGISLKNAVFRLEKTEIKEISYLLLYFRYTAVSDEKREGIMSVLINTMNMHVAPLENGIEDILENLKESDSTYAVNKAEMIKLFHAAYASSEHMVQERLTNFMKSLERRLNRDIKRIYEYYDTLKNETEIAIEKKIVLNPQMLVKLVDYHEDRTALLRKMIQERTVKAEGIDKLLDKLNAIETEQKWKIQDIITKYALNIKLESVAAIRIETMTPVFWINIKRRLESRQFPVTYNPILRQFDSLPCESCFNPYGGYYICDDNLHIVCSNCFKVCPVCGKQYCAACYKDKCPKCKKENE